MVPPDLKTILLSAALAALLPVAARAEPAPAPPAASGDIPAEFVHPDAQNDYTRRVEMIPMRDGVRLYTVIVIPRDARDAPMVLTRTPYDARKRAERTAGAPSMLALLPEADAGFVRAGFIRVYQDVRGKYGSEGAYEMTRPVRGLLNPSGTDNTTDAWDTIDWLVKSVAQSNGRVAMIGSSYEGFTVAMALLDPHPALRAAVPESPMIDGWMGDDWYHYGAFREPNLDYIAGQTEQKGEGEDVPRAAWDDYETFLAAGTPGAYAEANGFAQLGWWRKMAAHPAYDGFWQGQALDRLMAARPSDVPTLWEQGLWDQEDMWGANHAWSALRQAGHLAGNWLVIGPWYHSQVNRAGWSLGPFRWTGDTSRQFRDDMVMPFLSQYLKDGPPANLPRVTVYNPAENRWQRFDDWPVACEAGCAQPMRPLYLQAGFALSFDKPAGDRPAGGGEGDSYVSDPAKPVPFEPRPVRFSDREAWRTWLVHDQRFVDGRPDVLTYQTPVLAAPVRIQGAPVADIVAATTGTDVDVVVKLIDVYPALWPDQPELGGYELPIGTDIFRGRYRDSVSDPSPVPPDTPQRYRFTLPNANHVFLPGHRIMVQVQSTLFPLYDRNPQTYVDSILFAKPSDFRKATVTVLRTGDNASAVWLPVVP